MKWKPSPARTGVKVMRSNWTDFARQRVRGTAGLLEEQEPGVWLIRTAQVVPDNELWLHQPQAREELQRALEWAQRNPPRESELDAVAKELGDGEQGNPRSVKLDLNNEVFQRNWLELEKSERERVTDTLEKTSAANLGPGLSGPGPKVGEGG